MSGLDDALQLYRNTHQKYGALSKELHALSSYGFINALKVAWFH